MTNEIDWFETLQVMRQRWVDANKENDFIRGIWNATVEKYPDPEHFLFELMQNAEDEGAAHADLFIRDDAIVFEHDGGEFTRDDVDGITGIGNTTKLEEANKIGRFGIGFKSVYVVTERPEVHTFIDGQPFAFAIRDLVVPYRIEFAGREGWTRFVLPLKDRSSDLAGRLRHALRESGPRSMLFLERLLHLCWTDGTVRERYAVEDSGEGVRVLRREDDRGSVDMERYFVLSRTVTAKGSKSEQSVKVALKQNAEGDLIRTDATTTLAVFFETEEQTGLFFHVHGPFHLTDNRANIKRGDPWNEHLVDEIGRLIVESLPAIRDAGRLKRSFLELLPNSNDGLAAPWSKLVAPLVAAFKTQALVPAQFGGHQPASELARGPSDLRELLGDEGLQRLSGKAGVRWTWTGLRNSREDVFLGSLGIPDFGMVNFERALCAGLLNASGTNVCYWLDGLSDDAVQRLYLMLDGAKLSSTSLLVQHVPFVRIESGKRVRVSQALLPQPDDDAENEVDADDLAFVKQTLIRGGRGRGKEVEAFLRRIGVEVVSELHYLEAIARRFYKGTEGPKPTSELHLKHVRRFIAWWKEHGNVRPFATASWLRIEGFEGYWPPRSIYLDKPYADTGLGLIYDGRVPELRAWPVWSGYARLKRDDLLGLLGAAGVRSALVVERSHITPSHPHYRELKHGFYNSRERDTKVDQDHVIEELPALLARRDPRISAIVWRTLAEQPLEVLRARYRPNQQRETRTQPSTLAHVLATTAWLPAHDGTMKLPRIMTAADLAPGFSYGGNEVWLDAIGFGADHRRRSEQNLGRRKAAESIGLPPEFADALGEVPAAERAAVIDDLMRRLRERPAPAPEFPERSSANPERRARKVAENAQKVPVRTYEIRERSVRVSGGDAQASAKQFLRDCYTNDADEMVCQACHEEMPFRMGDGRPYFEAVEYVSGTTRELAENHLALCPNCAAKWRHANGESPESLLAALRGAVELHTTPVLAGEPVRLRFVALHLQDLKAALALGDDAPDRALTEASA